MNIDKSRPMCYNNGAACEFPLEKCEYSRKITRSAFDSRNITAERKENYEFLTQSGHP